MRKLWKLITPCVLMIVFCPLYGQEIIGEHEFMRNARVIQTIGYPLKVVPGDRGKFFFLEYWEQGAKEGEKKRITENFYLQSFGTRSYVEHWSKPVTEEGAEAMKEVVDLFRLKKGCFVVGEQYNAKKKQVETVGRFFNIEGNSKTQGPVTLSNYTNKIKRKHYKDEYAVSPNREAMVWLGTNNERFFCSAWAGNGDSIWSKELILDIPFTKYKLKQLMVDDSANVYLLMTHKPVSYSPRDVIPLPPIIVKYDSKRDAYNTVTLSLEQGVVLDARMGINGSDNLVLIGPSSDMTNGRFLINGAKLKTGKADEQRWTHLYFKRFRTFDMQPVAEKIVEIPEKIIRNFGEGGSNFSKMEVLMHRTHVVFIAEEQYQNKDKSYFLSIAAVAFKLTDGNFVWSEIVKKRQITKSSPHHMSYVPGISRERLRLVYLSEIGARGKILCTSVDLSSGKRRDKMLASNEEATYFVLYRKVCHGKCRGYGFVGVREPLQTKLQTNDNQFLGMVSQLS